jgi:diguanylate cyclase (GGDEF)-like protein/PAS domain S-box-containing protein
MNVRPHEALENQEGLALASSALESTADPSLICHVPADEDVPSSILYANRAFTATFGYSLEDVIGKSPRMLQGPDSDPTAFPRMRAGARAGLPQNEVLVLYTANGDRLYIEFRSRRIDATHRILVLRDITLWKAAQDSLAETTQRLDSLFSNNPDPIFVLDKHGTCVDANDEALAQLGFGRAALRAAESPLTGYGLFPGGESFPKELRAGMTMRFETSYRHRDGRLLPFEAKAIPILVAGSVDGAYVIAKDVTEARRSVERLAAQASRTHALYLISAATGTSERAQIEAALALVLKALDMQFGYVAVYEGGGLRIKYAVGEDIERVGSAIEQNSPHVLASLDVSDVFMHDDLHDRGHGFVDVPIYPDWHGYISARLSVGGQRYGAVGFVSRAVMHFEESDRDFIRLVSALVSATLERNIHEQRLNRLAYYDVLTGLTNRAKFMRDLEAAISHGQRHRRKFALHYIDLDGFKSVNDRAGHSVGDLALQEAARRLRDVARRHDIPARLGGDEFVLLQTEVADRAETATLGARIVNALSAPYALDDRTFELGASVGIATYPYDGKDARGLLKSADEALYRAKALGKHRVEVAAS